MMNDGPSVNDYVKVDGGKLLFRATGQGEWKPAKDDTQAQAFIANAMIDYRLRRNRHERNQTCGIP